MRMVPTVVFDTNVLVAGLRSKSGSSHRLLQSVGGDRFEVGLTTPLVLEYESVLKRPGMVPFSLEEIDTLLNFWCGVGICRPVWFSLRPAARDPNDDHVLEAAVATGSEILVTMNVKDMRDGARVYGIELLTPGEALGRLGVT